MARAARATGRLEERDAELVERFTRVRAWKRADERAPHKPLLLLYALARLQRGEPRLVPFAELETPVNRLLSDFGPPRRTRAEYPFWHLQSDGLWEIEERDQLQADLDGRPWRHNPRVTVIREVGARGGLPEDVARQLRRRPNLVNAITARLLEESFPRSVHEDLLDAVGMPWTPVRVRAPRDPGFREEILRIYRHRCAVCGYDAQLDRCDLGIEAAHVKWHAAGGADAPENGIALCAIHHKAFDRGALGLDDELRILVSQCLHGSETILRQWFTRFAGSPLGAPQPGCPPVAVANARWHRQEVLRTPPVVMS